jgi:transposase-like protein
VSMTGNNAKSEVLRGPERRRCWAAAEKIAIVAETYESDVTVSLVARRRGVRRTRCSAGAGWLRRAR